MLKRLLNIIPSRKSGKPKVIPRDQHPISRKNISHGALNIMKRLQESGFEGFLVGGGVRDLLLDGHPKDFDIATDATPEQVKRLFRGARIIGRRFRIVHVRMGREILEVTTFRAHHEDASHQREAASSDHGMLLRDNVYGTLASDAARRDFTINALYYTSKDFSIHDYAGGMKDIEQRIIRMIGDPATRYKEDPVRMLRAVRFAAKLGFTIEPKTAAPIAELADLLRHVPAARLFEEVLKLLMAGSAAATFNLLRDYSLLAHLFPATDTVLQSGEPFAERLLEQAMVNTDKRIRSNKRVTPAFIYAALLWPPVAAEMKRLEAKRVPSVSALQQAAQTVISRQLTHITIPKRFLIPMREIWDQQLRLPRRQGKRAERLMEHPRFRAAYDFVLLREEAGEDLNGLGKWWTRYQEADDQEREAMAAQVESSGPSKPRRRRRSRKSTSSAQQQP